MTIIHVEFIHNRATKPAIRHVLLVEYFCPFVVFPILHLRGPLSLQHRTNLIERKKASSMKAHQTQKQQFIRVHVFETNIDNYDLIEAISPRMESLEGVLKWTVDTEDISNVLRVEAIGLSDDLIKNAICTEDIDVVEMQD